MKFAMAKNRSHTANCPHPTPLPQGEGVAGDEWISRVEGLSLLPQGAG